jgi:multisubunit Na+/H+ antiporter MnhE subunit
VHRARRFLIWWVLLTALWLELVSSSSWAYILIGLGCAALSALAALLAHETMHERYAVDPGWLGWFPAALPSSVVDTLRLARLLLRPASERRAGRLRELPMPVEGPRRSAGRRALAVVVLGLAPGSYVVNVDDRGGLLLHELPGSSDSLARRVCR